MSPLSLHLTPFPLSFWTPLGLPLQEKLASMGVWSPCTLWPVCLHCLAACPATLACLCQCTQCRSRACLSRGSAGLQGRVHCTHAGTTALSCALPRSHHGKACLRLLPGWRQRGGRGPGSSWDRLLGANQGDFTRVLFWFCLFVLNTMI